MPGVLFLGESRVAVLIDGGHLRARARSDRREYNADLIESICWAALAAGEAPHRFLYYDCASFAGTTRLPVSGGLHTFDGSDAWLRSLASRDLFAVRRGVLKFRGWTPKSVPVRREDLSDSDFTPSFEQKGVDMRIGLDVATFCRTRAVDLVVLVTGDTDCVPVLKHARIGGLQTGLAVLPRTRPPPELTWHADFVRQLEWP
jgi:hypothetical protein